AEDGIRDDLVTGVQTCALPISTAPLRPELVALYAVAVATGSGDDLVVAAERTLEVVCGVARMAVGGLFRFDPAARALVVVAHRRSEERRVGNECGGGWRGVLEE